ncbi:MAG: type II toxin-antitoxin system HigB family toxin [Bacteroidales bacterium]|nr:type II toxin-antitoxin system HigB family toxin [Bacteroidales bacterium]
MRVIARKTLREFWNNHSDSEDALKAWFWEAQHSRWKSPAHIKKKYPHASILPDNRVVFNIKGNTYRLVVKINYDYGQVFIRFAGTHAEYDKIDATTI